MSKGYLINQFPFMDKFKQITGQHSKWLDNNFLMLSKRIRAQAITAKVIKYKNYLRDDQILQPSLLMTSILNIQFITSTKYNPVCYQRKCLIWQPNVTFSIFDMVIKTNLIKNIFGY